MSRHNRRRREDRVPAPSSATHRVEQWQGEDYAVRSVAGANAVKSYRCPGCDQLIPAGVPHLVTWPNLDPEADDRRHWHTTCWAARHRRGPGIQRSRSAPRH